MSICNFSFFFRFKTNTLGEGTLPKNSVRDQPILRNIYLIEKAQSVFFVAIYTLFDNDLYACCGST